MPKKALVSCGAVLGLLLLALPVPAWCSEMNSSKGAVGQSVDSAPKIIEEQTEKQTVTVSELTLDDVIDRTLNQNPKLATFTQEVRAREFESRQAGRYPNPELSIEMENIAGSGEFSGTDSAETTIRISQLFELGGKRARRQEIGRTEQFLAEQEYNIVRTELLSETTAQFFAVLAAQQRLYLAGEQIELTRKVLQSIEDRITEGKGAVIEKIRFHTVVAEAKLRQQKKRLELTAARQTLATAWGSAEVDFETVRGRLDKLHSTPNWSELTARVDQSQIIALRKNAVIKADRILALERANRIPDLTFSLGAKNNQSTGDNSFVMGISIPLQAFNRNQDRVAAALARKAKSEEEKRSTQSLMRASLASGWRTLQAARSEVLALREEIIPATQESFDSIAYGYQAGKFGILELLDAERTLFDAKSRYIDALENYHQAFLELELLLGQKISTTKNPSGSDENQRGQS